MKRVSTQGGPALTICELRGGLVGAAWGTDGTIIFGSGDPNAWGLWRVPATGGEPQRLTTADGERDNVRHGWPEILPGGEAVLFTITERNEGSDVAVLSLDSLGQKIVIPGASNAQYSPTGHLVYSLDGSLWAVRFDLDRLETVGDPVPVQGGVLTGSASAAAVFSMSDDGTLLYTPGTSDEVLRRRLVWVYRDGRQEAVPGDPTNQYWTLELSPTGSQAAIELFGAGHIAIYDFTSDTLGLLTDDPGFDGHPVWTPDERSIIWSAERDGGAHNLFRRAVDGSDQEDRLTTSSNTQNPYDVSPDGKYLLVRRQINPDQCACFVRETSCRFTVLRGVHRFSRLRCASVLRLTCSRRARIAGRRPA